ncbi:MAG: biotin transporter BioY [Oscillospiraceae bacterium]
MTNENTISKKKVNVLALVMCALFAALIAVGAFIQIPLPHLDYFTLQFLFVILSGIILGPKLGAISVAVYVLLGLAGVPIFAAGGGIAYVLRPSFGYLAAFIGASAVTGLLCKKLKADKFRKYLLAALGGFVVTYAIGLVYEYFMATLYLGEETTLWVIFLDCFPIDMPGDLVLCAIAAFIGKRTEGIRRRFIKIEY